MDGSFTWKIRDRSTIQRLNRANKNDAVTSNMFRLFGLDWFLQLRPNGLTRGDGYGHVFVVLCLHKFPFNRSRFTLKFQFELRETNTAYAQSATFKADTAHIAWDKNLLFSSDIAALSQFTITVSMQLTAMYDSRGVNVLQNLHSSSSSSSSSSLLHMPGLPEQTETVAMLSGDDLHSSLSSSSLSSSRSPSSSLLSVSTCTSASSSLASHAAHYKPKNVGTNNPQQSNSKLNLRRMATRTKSLSNLGSIFRLPNSLRSRTNHKSKSKAAVAHRSHPQLHCNYRHDDTMAVLENDIDDDSCKLDKLEQMLGSMTESVQALRDNLQSVERRMQKYEHDQQYICTAQQQQYDLVVHEVNDMQHDICGIQRTHRQRQQQQLLETPRKYREISSNDAGDRNVNLKQDLTRLNQWLITNVQLPQYYAVFVEHGIDEMELLVYVTKVELVEMGVYRVGHQMRILEEIDILRQQIKRKGQPEEDSSFCACESYKPSMVEGNAAALCTDV